ncbi:hypothetical protein Cni_G26044 [Canna indica]|uniref:MaoC-like domain-containing protein n=1 Tax=Canna indica TaxID=4628 RepID=A0AAQ3KZ10_9LILI|nr:hypothetical protein Cni_G26044 [Canna indica]
MMQLGRFFRIVPSRSGFVDFCSLFSSSTPSESAKTLLRIGDVLRESRRFSESDVTRFSDVSGDRNPIHLDAEFARAVAGFDGGPLVHGMLVASLFPSVIASHFSLFSSIMLSFWSFENLGCKYFLNHYKAICRCF